MVLIRDRLLFPQSDLLNLGGVQMIKHFSQRRRPIHYSSKLFIALWLQAHDAVTSRPISLQLRGRRCAVFQSGCPRIFNACRVSLHYQPVESSSVSHGYRSVSVRLVVVNVLLNCRLRMHRLDTRLDGVTS